MGTDFVLMSAPLLLETPLEIESTGNVRSNIPYALEKRNDRGASGFSRILFKRFPGMQSVRGVASSIRLKTTERSHFRTSLSYAHYKLGVDYNYMLMRRSIL